MSCCCVHFDRMDSCVCAHSVIGFFLCESLSLSLSFFYFYFRNSSSSSFPSSSQLSAALCRLYCKQGRCKNTTHTHTDRQLSDDNGVEMEMEEDGKERKKGHWQVELVGVSRKKKKKKSWRRVWFNALAKDNFIFFIFLVGCHIVWIPHFTHSFLPLSQLIIEEEGRKERKKEESRTCVMSHTTGQGWARLYFRSCPVRSDRLGSISVSRARSDVSFFQMEGKWHNQQHHHCCTVASLVVVVVSFYYSPF